jgi:hypothetical protein
MTCPIKTQNIKTLIEDLTSDEDIRQDLWLAVLSHPHDVKSIYDFLLEIKIQREHDTRLHERMLNTLARYQGSDIPDLLSTMSPTQQSIVGLLMLGFTVEYISSYKKIQHRRIIAALYNALEIVKNYT